MLSLRWILVYNMLIFLYNYQMYIFGVLRGCTSSVLIGKVATLTGSDASHHGGWERDRCPLRGSELPKGRV